MKGKIEMPPKEVRNTLIDCLKEHGEYGLIQPLQDLTTMEVELEDVLEWVDGVLGALGTEHADKITEREAAIAFAISEHNKSFLAESRLQAEPLLASSSLKPV